ncbi:hypothetical protein CO676_24280 [Sinorhizobium sp. BJ1]|nr:hypothetical protein CO676_24280 [Sinorhizobium sp. BJ1]
MTIWLGRDAAQVIIEQANIFFPLETGGVLLGWRDGEDRVVVDIVGAGPKALHGRHTFIPDHSWQVEQIDEAFRNTAGDLDYLGDWHSHPAGVAAMSSEDRSTLRRISRRVRHPIMVIAAGRNANWTFGGWMQLRPRLLRRSVAECQPIQYFAVPSEWPRAPISGE